MPQTAWLPLLALALVGGPAAAARYRFDPAHTVPRFEIDHLRFFTERGRFTRAYGVLDYDETQQTGRLDVVIDAASIDTGNAARDEVLRSPEWFDVAHHPTITFSGGRLVFDGARPVAVKGDLTLLGTTRPVTLRITRLQCATVPTAPPPVCLAWATGSLQRSRFGMRAGRPLIGDEVRLHIEAEARLDPDALSP